MKRRVVLSACAGVVLVSGVALGVPALPQAPIDAQETSPAMPRRAPREASPAPIGADLDMMLKQYDAEEQSITDEIDGIDKERTEVDARVVARGRVYYKQVRAGLLPAGGGFEELVDYAAKVERTHNALTRDLERATALEHRRAALQERLARLKADRTPLEMHRQAMTEARSALQQAEERRQAFGRAFESSTGASYSAIYGADPGPVNEGSHDGFKTLFGHLPLPIAGRAEVHKLDKTEQHGPAIELTAPKGAVARAVAAGRVAFADRVDDDHITVLLDHGDRYFTLYGNLVSTDVKVGESVPANSALGPVAGRGGQGPTLYFELRTNGQAADPGPWLGL